MNRFRTNYLKTAVLASLLLLAAAALSAQTVPDPAVQQAKEETAVVYDLGRFFGYVHTMSTENGRLALSAAQKEEIQRIMIQIKEMKRIEPDWAAETLEYLELDLLTPAQLMEVDRRAIEWLNTRQTPAQAGTGAGSGSGPMSSYVAGGPFNPIIDETKTIGQGFAALFEYTK